MKRHYTWIYSLILIGVLSGCSTQEAPMKEESQSVAKQVQPDVKAGVTHVLQLVEQLETYLKTSANQVEVQKFGKSIAQAWDTFEDAVEESYPDQYEKIESHLYPLIGETGKQPLDINKIQDLIQKVQADLALFIKQLPQ